MLQASAQRKSNIAHVAVFQLSHKSDHFFVFPLCKLPIPLNTTDMKVSKMNYPFIIIPFLSLLITSAIADDCRPVTWAKNDRRALTTSSLAPTSFPTLTSSLPEPTVVQSGNINCRAWSRPYGSVNYYTCTEICNKYEIDTDFLFTLNPHLKRDCSNIQTGTKYCVDGCEL